VEHVSVLFDAESHTADAIQRAGYRFADRFSLELAREDGSFSCVLRSAEPLEEELIEQFRVAVVDYVLRERIRDETEGVRNVVLALAFQNAAVDAAAVETVDQE
jgi:His-Xaa-Ser system protein HxsD